MNPAPDSSFILHPSSLSFALTYHVEGPLERPSAEIYAEIAEQVELADRLGLEYAWFSEHHAHAHHGHMPVPLLLALHLAGRTRAIRLGTAIICLNLHHPLGVAEQVTVADLLSGGRMAMGFGSGSTPEEFGLFGLPVTGAEERHARFEGALRVMVAVWDGKVCGGECADFPVPPHRPLPAALPDLKGRCWLAVNSEASAAIAGRLGFNMMFSHLRTPDQYRAYRQIYAESGGRGLVAANRPMFVAEDDAAAWREAEPALRTLWRRFQREGKIPADLMEPRDVERLTAHPINFLVGGPDSVARQIRELREYVPFEVMNLEPRWAELSPFQVQRTIRLLAEEVRPRIRASL